MGVMKRHPGYVTDILTDLALDFFRNRRQPDRPFLLMLQHKAPHRNWQPALRHLHTYDDAEFPLPETLFDDYATRSRAAREQEMTIRTFIDPASDLKMGPPLERLTPDEKAAWEAAYAPKRAAYEKAKPQGDDLVRWKFRRYMQDCLGRRQAAYGDSEELARAFLKKGLEEEQKK
jgi:hypothetical protein